MQLRKMEWIYKDESCFTEKFEQFIGYFFIKMEVLRLDFFRVRFWRDYILDAEETIWYERKILYA